MDKLRPHLFLFGGIMRIKRFIISLCLILCVLFGSVTASASAAVDTSTFASLVVMALHGIHIVVDSTTAPVQNLLDTIVPDLNISLPGFPSYTYSGPSWDDDILSRSFIKINKDVVTIDGVEYTDIWLSHDAAEKFRVNAFDFQSAFNIASESNGTFASGVGFLRGFPLYNVNGTIRTQTFRCPDLSFNNGLIAGSVRYIGSSPYMDVLWWDNVNTGKGYYINPTSYRDAYVMLYQGSWRVNLGGASNARTIAWDNNPFDFDYVSSIIPVDPLPSDYGLNIRVPSSYSDPSSGDVIYDFGDIVIEYPDFSGGQTIELDPTLNPNFQIDTDFLDDLGDLLNTILNIWDLLNDAPDGTSVEFKPYEEPSPEPSPEPEPTPPPSPVPSTPVSDQPAEWLDQILRWIQETVNAVKTATQTVTQTLEQVLELIETLPQEILQDIETAPIKVYQSALEVIKVVFAPIIALLRSVIGLWHYVVEWVTATSPVFARFFGFMSSTNYNMVLPIYAALAGPIVIAVYKRFGR